MILGFEYGVFCLEHPVTAMWNQIVDFLPSFHIAEEYFSVLSIHLKQISK